MLFTSTIVVIYASVRFFFLLNNIPFKTIFIKLLTYSFNDSWQNQQNKIINLKRNDEDDDDDDNDATFAHSKRVITPEITFLKPNLINDKSKYCFAKTIASTYKATYLRNVMCLRKMKCTERLKQ